MQKRSEKMILVSSIFEFMVPVKHTGPDSILLPNHKKSNYVPGAPIQGFVWVTRGKQVFITTDQPRGHGSRAHTFLMNRLLHFLPIISNKIAGVARFKNRHG
jgi:hypothetical protein